MMRLLYVWCACEIVWDFAYLHKLGHNGIPELWGMWLWAVKTALEHSPVGAAWRCERVLDKPSWK